MTDISQLSSASSISDGDLFPIFSSGNSDTRKVSWAALVANMVAQGLVTVASIASALGFTPVVAANKILRYTKTGTTLNSANTDVTTFTGLPAKYRVRKFSVFDASVSMAASAATAGLYAGPGATGANLVVLATLVALTAASKITDMALAAIAGTDYQTGPILYVRNGAAHGTALTVTFALEIEDLT